MRAVVLVACMATAVPVAAQPGPPPPAPPRTLTAAELSRYIEPYVPEVRACYLTRVPARQGTGELRLELVVAPDGSVRRLGVVAPGVRGKKLEACVRAAAASWHFPVRPGHTTAAIPFYFQRTRGNTGPYPGCASPRGCPGPRRTP